MAPGMTKYWVKKIRKKLMVFLLPIAGVHIKMVFKVSVDSDHVFSPWMDFFCLSRWRNVLEIVG
jgi:hypothetical protein